MLDVARLHACVVACHGSAPALEALAVPAGALALRVAPDELLLLAPPARAEELLRRATAHLAVVEPGALAVDQSDGWAIFGLPGHQPEDEGVLALRQLALMPLPRRRPAFVQGAVAGGPAKLLLLPEVVYLLVPFALRDHVARRLCDVAAPTGVRIAELETPFPSLAGEPAWDPPP